MSSGTLYIMATPIGNLTDLTDRAKATLRTVDCVAAEDTRQSLKILRHLELEKPIVRADEFSQRKHPERIIDRLEGGASVALVTDAGTPGISDPGSFLVQAAWERGIPIVPIPGPSAVITALSMCGFETIPFTFFGFLAKKGGARKEYLRRMIEGPQTSCFFESPHRLHKTLGELAILAPERMAFVARELTKKFEQTYRAPLRELAELFEKRPPKGECTVVVSPPEDA